MNLNYSFLINHDNLTYEYSNCTCKLMIGSDTRWPEKEFQLSDTLCPKGWKAYGSSCFYLSHTRAAYSATVDARHMFEGLACGIEQLFSRARECSAVIEHCIARVPRGGRRDPRRHQ